MRKLSVVIIAKDAQDVIIDAIDSVSSLVKNGGEVLVIDNGSIDMTSDVSKRAGARVVMCPKRGYPEARNKGLEEAKGEWLLYVDADERSTPKLNNEIDALLSNNNLPFPMYAIPRKNIILGREFHHGGFGGFDYVKRLFLKKTLKKWTGDIHEEPNYIFKGKLTKGKDGELGYIENKLTHVKAETITEMLDKTNWWSEKEAKLMYDSGHPPMNIMRFSSAILRELWFRFVKMKAYRDGAYGTIHGSYQIFSRFVSYAKLWEMQEK